MTKFGQNAWWDGPPLHHFVWLAKYHSVVRPPLDGCVNAQCWNLVLHVPVSIFQFSCCSTALHRIFKNKSATKTANLSLQRILVINEHVWIYQWRSGRYILDKYAITLCYFDISNDSFHNILGIVIGCLLGIPLLIFLIMYAIRYFMQGNL